MTPTKDLQTVLDRAWNSPFTTKSDFARTHTNAVAAAASSGLITTQIRAREFGTNWRITKQGLELLNEFYR